MTKSHLADRVGVRLSNIMESVTILYADERSGDDRFEADISVCARAAGFYLVEDEDGDLVARTVEEPPGGIWEGDDDTTDVE